MVFGTLKTKILILRAVVHLKAGLVTHTKPTLEFSTYEDAFPKVIYPAKQFCEKQTDEKYGFQNSKAYIFCSIFWHKFNLNGTLTLNRLRLLVHILHTNTVKCKIFWNIRWSLLIFWIFLHFSIQIEAGFNEYCTEFSSKINFGIKFISLLLFSYVFELIHFILHCESIYRWIHSYCSSISESIFFGLLQKKIG